MFLQIYHNENNAFILLSHFHKFMPRYLSPGEIKKDNSLKGSFCNKSFSPSFFQFHSISFFHVDYIWVLFILFTGFHPAQFMESNFEIIFSSFLCI